MNRMIGMILEMVFVAMIVVWLLTYLIRGQINGGTGVWDGMGQSDALPGNSTAVYEMDEQTAQIVTAQAPDIRCLVRQIQLNRTYELNELFAAESGEACFLEIADIYLGGESVLARGDIKTLAEAETPAGALYDGNSKTLMFTRTGSYRAVVRVGTAYGQKARRELWVTLPAVSDFVLQHTGKEGG